MRRIEIMQSESNNISIEGLVFIGKKDKNGNYMKEGDVIEITYNDDIKKRFLIEWNQFDCSFRLIGKNKEAYSIIFADGRIKDYRVIGNINFDKVIW